MTAKQRQRVELTWWGKDWMDRYIIEHKNKPVITLKDRAICLLFLIYTLLVFVMGMIVGTVLALFGRSIYITSPFEKS